MQINDQGAIVVANVFKWLVKDKANISVVVANLSEKKDDSYFPFYEDTLDFLDLNYPSQPPCDCLLYTSPSPRDRTRSRMPSSA